MKKTIQPEHKEYKSVLGHGEYKTLYGKIRSWGDGIWWHDSLNNDYNELGEEYFFSSHSYYLNL